MIHKFTRWRSDKYKAWVKSQACVLCGAPADDPHHIKGVGYLSGAGLTAPDYCLIPVCRPCHRRFHAEPELWESQWEHALRTIGKAIEQGVLR